MKLKQFRKIKYYGVYWKTEFYVGKAHTVFSRIAHNSYIIHIFILKLLGNEICKIHKVEGAQWLWQTSSSLWTSPIHTLLYDTKVGSYTSKFEVFETLHSTKSYKKIIYIFDWKMSTEILKRSSK